MRFKNRWKLYEIINKIPRVSPLSLKLMLKWSSKKLERHLNRLKKDGFIKEKNNRYYPTPWKELINWDEFNKPTKLPEDYTPIKEINVKRKEFKKSKK